MTITTRSRMLLALGATAAVIAALSGCSAAGGPHGSASVTTAAKPATTSMTSTIYDVTQMNAILNAVGTPLGGKVTAESALTQAQIDQAKAQAKATTVSPASCLAGAALGSDAIGPANSAHPYTAGTMAAGRTALVVMGSGGAPIPAQFVTFIGTTEPDFLAHCGSITITTKGETGTVKTTPLNVSTDADATIGIDQQTTTQGVTIDVNIVYARYGNLLMIGTEDVSVTDGASGSSTDGASDAALSGTTISPENMIDRAVAAAKAAAKK